jgi:chromodomain-helicase-DNA-binding protein 7
LEGLNWLINNWHLKRNVILADEMGLGKTAQTISFVNHLVMTVKVKGPFLIIAPLSTIDHWKKTIDEWTSMNGIV